MNKKGLFAGLAIGIMLLGACQDQGKKVTEEKIDLAGTTWTDGLYFFNVAKCDSGYNCEGGSTHEGGIMFMLVPTDDGFVTAEGNNGVEKTDSNYTTGYCFDGEVGDKVVQKVFNDKNVLIHYNKENKVIATYLQTTDIVKTMNENQQRYLFSGEFTKEDGSKVVFDATKFEVTGLSADATAIDFIYSYDLPSGSFKLGNEAYNVKRTDEGITLQPIKQSKEDEELWDDAGKPIVLKRVQGSDDQTGNVSKEILNSSQLGFFTKNERAKMRDDLKAKGDKASEIETINLQMLEKMIESDNSEE
ncbi:MAG: hypothetical protein IKZ61_03845 [Prevotella sp.]|nr:hypothetical protein [Prevotella sp.]